MSAFKVRSNSSYLEAVPTDENVVKLRAGDCGDTAEVRLEVVRDVIGASIIAKLDPNTAMELADWLFNWAFWRIAATDHTTTVGEALRRLTKK